MRKYLKYLSYGFFTLVLYYCINLFMALITTLFYASEHDKIYGSIETARDPKVLTLFFVIVCIVFVMILFGFFLFGKVFKIKNEKMFFSFILFIMPNLALQILIYYSYSIELMCLLNWYLAPLSDVFFFETQTAYDLRFSYLGNSLLTYLPFIAAFLGGVTKRNKGKKNNAAVGSENIPCRI